MLRRFFDSVASSVDIENVRKQFGDIRTIAAEAESLLRNPVGAVAFAEQYARALHAQVANLRYDLQMSSEQSSSVRTSFEGSSAVRTAVPLNTEFAPSSRSNASGNNNSGASPAAISTDDVAEVGEVPTPAVLSVPADEEHNVFRETADWPQDWADIRLGFLGLHWYCNGDPLAQGKVLSVLREFNRKFVTGRRRSTAQTGSQAELRERLLLILRATKTSGSPHTVVQAFCDAWKSNFQT